MDFGQLEITDSVAINGPGKDRIAISGKNRSRVIWVAKGTRAKIQGLTIRDGRAEDFGGGILNKGDLQLDSCTIIENVAVSDGADTTFGGGGIENRGSLGINKCRVERNVLEGEHDASQDIDNGGGGINNIGKLRILDSRIVGNRAFNAGGIRTSEGSLVMIGSIVEKNSASGIVGGGLALAQSKATIRRSQILNNEAIGPYGNSGGISNDSSETVLEDVVIQGNQTTGFGGGIVIAAVQEGGGASSVTLRNSRIIENSARFGGGIAVIDGSILNLTRSLLEGNKAQRDGGAIWVGNFLGGLGLSKLKLRSSQIRGNSAEQKGGGLYNQIAGRIDHHKVTIATNTASIGGGVFLEQVPAGPGFSESNLTDNLPDDTFINESKSSRQQ